MREGSGGLLLLVPLVLAATACASGGRGHIPPLTLEPTGTYTVGRFVWYDLLSDDVPAVKQFYGTLFGWEFEGDYGDEGDFTLITHHGQPIGGIVYAEPLEDGVSRSRWIPSLSVADVDQAVDQVRQSGGTVYFQPEDVPDRGRISVVGDPQGAIVAFVRTTSGDPVEVDPPRGGWLWTELWTRDVEAAVEFYRSLVGYEYEIIAHAVLGDYGVLKRDGDARAGVRKIPWEDVMPNWLPYVRVADPGAIVAQVERLGGRVLIAPNDSIRSGSVALIGDPAGAAVAIQQWPVDGERTGGQ